MGMSVGGDGDFNSEINVTPMVDIMLVLMIIFMVVTPLLQQGVSVNLPKDLNNPEADAAIVKETSVVLAIPNNSEVYIGKERYPKDALTQKDASGKNPLQARIETLMERKTAEERIVYVKSDVDVDYGTVVEVINTVRAAGIDKIGLVGDKKKGGGSEG